MRSPRSRAGYEAQFALTEALFGNRAAAIESARKVPASVTYAPRARAATALAIAGDTAGAEAILRDLRALRPDDTLLHTAYLPVAEAALFLARGKPADAIEVSPARDAIRTRNRCCPDADVLQRPKPGCNPATAAEAVKDFQDVLDSRGAEPFSPALPLAQLGPRACAQPLGDSAGSARAYSQLMAVWQTADADVPVVKQRPERKRPPQCPGSPNGEPHTPKLFTSVGTHLADTRDRR